MIDNMLERLRKAAGRKVLFLPHAVKQMSRPDRMITIAEIRRIIRTGSIIENYPDDPRGHSCLMLGKGSGRRPIHVVCAPKADYLAIITAYLPSPEEWEDGFKKRKLS